MNTVALTVIFRADASPDIGGGHVQRCLALANALRYEQANVWFACRPKTFDTLPRLRDSGHNFIELPATGDERAYLRAATPWADWLVIDHYGLDAEWMSPLRDWSRNVLVIDDLSNRPLDCDILLDQTYLRQAIDYQPLTPKHCQFLLGTDYALLRPEFAAARSKYLAKRQTPNKHKPIVLVAMGATDPENITVIVLNALDALALDFEFNIILGSAAPHLNAVYQCSRSLRHSCAVKVDVIDMVDLIGNADIAIGACGTSSWERCCLGLPTITIELADNQKLISTTLNKVGAVYSLGRHQELSTKELRRKFSQLISSPEKMLKMSNISAQICDGLGAKRVADRMLA